MPIARDSFAARAVVAEASATVQELTQKVDALKAQAVKKTVLVKSGMPLFVRFSEPAVGDRQKLLVPLSGKIMSFWVCAELPKTVSGGKVTLTIDGVGRVFSLSGSATGTDTEIACPAGSVIEVQLVSLDTASGAVVERIGDMLVGLAFVGDDRVQTIYDAVPEIYIAETGAVVQAVKAVEE